ncbi:MAG: type II toxin-antitoxin system Phd/YefM family antitoxin [Deltaproteobacteria bacterium]|nr:type II toxin-antitoxin system Phd/YefM family antitoxin [Deltaproteobacteria bacterium]
MRDHLKDSKSEPEIQKLVGVRELKADAASILRQVRDSRASYVLTHRGRAVGVILPLEATDRSVPLDDADVLVGWNDFVRAGRRLKRRFRPGVSGVRLLSSMRR